MVTRLGGGSIRCRSGSFAREVKCCVRQLGQIVWLISMCSERWGLLALWWKDSHQAQETTGLDATAVVMLRSALPMAYYGAIDAVFTRRDLE